MSVASGPVRGYRLAVPGWWDRVDLTSPHREQVVEQLVARQFRGLDDAPLARRNTSRMLVEQVRDAHRLGGLELHVSARAVAGVVLPASLLVHVVPADAVHADEGFLPWSAAAGPGLRRRREQPLGGDGDPGATVVEFRVPAPVATPEPTWLALTASTTSGVLADHLVGLFDAVATTLRWTT